ncbi:MAG: hypothetical protein ACOCX4_07255 [Planctomycetota bacterium]
MRRAVPPLLAALVVLVFACGCDEPRETRALHRLLQPVNAHDALRDVDPAVLATAQSIAVVPPENLTGEDHFDALLFAQKLADGLAATGALEVRYPREVYALVEDHNRRIRLHNNNLQKNRLLGKDPESDRLQRMREDQGDVAATENRPLRELDPVRHREDALVVARELGVDLVIRGAATDYDPYYRPRVTLRLEALPTGRSADAAHALAELTQWGVSRSLRSPTGVAWTRQQVFDTANGGVAREVYLYARKRHTEKSAFDTEIYLRSMDRFFEFVGHTLAGRVLDAKARAADLALQKAEEEARRRGREQAAVRARVVGLVRGDAVLPDGREIVTKNLYDRRDTSWRRDEVARRNPEQTRITTPPPARGVEWTGR